MNIYNLKRNKHFIARLKKINKKKKNIFPYCAEWAHKTGAGSDAPRKWRKKPKKKSKDACCVLLQHILVSTIKLDIAFVLEIGC